MAEISSVLSIIIVGILVIGILIVLTWSLFNMSQVTSMGQSVVNIPYCVREACTPSGNQEPAYTILPSNDPQRLGYQHLSYCMSNSPPCDLVKALGVCASPETANSTSRLPAVTDDEIRTLAKFLAEQYLGPITNPTIPNDPTNPNTARFTGPCTYAWVTPNGVTANSVTPGPGQSDPNSPNLKDGPNNPFLVNLVACASKRPTVANDPNVVALKNACGTLCRGSSS